MTNKTETPEEHRVRRKAEIKKAWDAALSEPDPVESDPVEKPETYCTEHGRQFESAGGYRSHIKSHTE